VIEIRNIIRAVLGGKTYKNAQKGGLLYLFYYSQRDCPYLWYAGPGAKQAHSAPGTRKYCSLGALEAFSAPGLAARAKPFVVRRMVGEEGRWRVRFLQGEKALFNP